MELNVDEDCVEEGTMPLPFPLMESDEGFGFMLALERRRMSRRSLKNGMASSSHGALHTQVWRTPVNSYAAAGAVIVRRTDVGADTQPWQRQAEHS